MSRNVRGPIADFHSCLSRTTSSPTRTILKSNVLTNHTHVINPMRIIGSL